MKNFRSLNTDFYQLSMCVAYVLTDSANDKCGFEAFYRRTNKSINPDDFYYFSGAKEVIELMEMTKRELQDPEYLETFIELVKDKLPKDRKDLYIKLIRDKWKYLDKDFHYSVYPENAKLFPYVPAVQFYGPKFIGQILETSIVNIVNGKTGFNTKDKLDNFDSVEERMRLGVLVNNDHLEDLDVGVKFVDELFKRAEEYRNSTSKILLEAGYRRACSFDVAKIASEIALASGWNGTSNTSIADKYLDKINGTMAHSFIMGHRTQLEALFKWNMIYPNSTILSCTYDVMECLELMITYNIKPVMVRIDVEPLADLARKVRDRLDSVGWNDVKIFLSGDLTPERLRKFEEDGVPFDACMAGTSFVNVGGTDKVNAEFVYKLVEFEKDGKMFYPEKKANGKDSKSGLKNIRYNTHNKVLEVTTEKFVDGETQSVYVAITPNRTKERMGFYEFDESTKIIEAVFG